jgi:hypothetical protein
LCLAFEILWVVVGLVGGHSNLNRSHQFGSKDYAGLYPLGNIAAPKNQLVKIRAVRVRIGQESGTTRLYSLAKKRVN